MSCREQRVLSPGSISGHIADSSQVKLSCSCLPARLNSLEPKESEHNVPQRSVTRSAVGSVCLTKVEKFCPAISYGAGQVLPAAASSDVGYTLASGSGIAEENIILICASGGRNVCPTLLGMFMEKGSKVEVLSPGPESNICQDANLHPPTS